jgi:hypothetical protein
MQRYALMETERLNNRSHGQNLSSISGEPESFAQYFFENLTTGKLSHYSYVFVGCLFTQPISQL